MTTNTSPIYGLIILSWAYNAMNTSVANSKDAKRKYLGLKVKMVGVIGVNE